MSPGFDRRAARVLPDAAAVERHDAGAWHLRAQRDAAVAQVGDFEELRSHASAIKAHTLDHLDRYLEEFEEQARDAGAVVHWAEAADDHNQIVYELLRERGVVRAVKSKSMLTEECGLNAFLEARGIEVVDTDLGERILQLAKEPPSHIVVPAIHKTRADVGRLFSEKMGGISAEAPAEQLVEHARRDLRARFLGAQAGITGANFAVAQTGSIVVCTNEGNADLGTSLPPLHIVCMGIEKLIPTHDDLAVFLRLLARSATGQAITAYSTVHTGPVTGRELHVVLVDNGRSRLLADRAHRQSLACIRCGACLNTCPVYRRSGGHAYGLTIPGPIGQAQSPVLGGLGADPELPFASSLCGSCSAVCPVRIDLHGQLLAWRRERPGYGWIARLGLRLAAAAFRSATLYRLAARLLRAAWPRLSRPGRFNPAGRWLSSRELPPHPGPGFREQFLRRRDPDVASTRTT
ncbi:MAG: lactate utilization protein [Myxococcales bacterium]|nr:lactate utilization protein [Myxococcales bacterium]